MKNVPVEQVREPILPTDQVNVVSGSHTVLSAECVELSLLYCISVLCYASPPPPPVAMEMGSTDFICSNQ